MTVKAIDDRQCWKQLTLEWSKQRG